MVLELPQYRSVVVVGFGWLDTELKIVRDFFAFKNRNTVMGNGEYVSTFVMPELRDRLQYMIAIIKELYAWQSFATELETIKTLLICFPDSKISHISRVQNRISDSLAKTARSFYREICYIGCFILIWLPRPPQETEIETEAEVIAPMSNSGSRGSCGKIFLDR
ncbi:hypothetical protein IGI04_015065 [Brassica rapa subsp. trilocularis]|uniref:RNase H type-1 domain-containing protein n=1 Tax=Brassica rapa subsp. trilocularis TaxID=1813537 RepID=A0ABQ7MNZ3_BRACM|nr:hypothetical protein IGI04_015065 [Brassica rapa subsp. trilocularis]